MHLGLIGFAVTAVALAPHTKQAVHSQLSTAKRDRMTHVQPRRSSSESKAWMTGTFDSPFGLTTLSPKGGKYDYDGGTLTVTHIDGVTMEGIWHQNSAGQCPDGGYWGHYHFTFTRTGFTGVFGHCEGALISGPWKGTRRTK